MYDNWLLYNTELAQCVLVDCHSLSNYWDSENILNIPSLDANGTTNFGRGGCILISISYCFSPVFTKRCYHSSVTFSTI